MNWTTIIFYWSCVEPGSNQRNIFSASVKMFFIYY